jgi:cytoskeletal protein CcmA (bactofilin family)
MAIFNKSDGTHTSTDTDSNTTIIAAGTTIKGDMTLTCNLYVDGDFEGIIHSDKQVIIGKKGHAKGNVYTNRLVVQGYIEGAISAEKVEIKAAGRVNGTIESTELMIEARGIFEGTSIVKGVKPAPKKTVPPKIIKTNKPEKQ